VGKGAWERSRKKKQKKKPSDPGYGWEICERKSQASRTSKNPFEKSSSKQAQYNTNGLGGMVL
jgi:hypothetical protein